MRASIRDRLRRYGFAVLTLVLGALVMTIPVIRGGAGTPIIVYFFAILLSAWYGGLGPGLFATAVIVLLTSHTEFVFWRVVRLALGIAGGVAISVLAEVLHRARRRAEAANQAKDRFLAMLSHELRTPLTPVLAAATAILDEPGTADELRPTLELIRDGVELEARLIDDLLDLTRVAHGKLCLARAPVDMHALIHQTLAICRADLGAKRMDLELDLAAGAPWVAGDATRLQQVLWNLIKNAVKFTPAGETLTIRSRNEAGPGPMTRLVVEVCDTGIGIAPEQLEWIFEPFEQGGEGRSRPSGGLGLGLAISRGIAEAHGGRLTAESTGLGQGATFRLTLEGAEVLDETIQGPDRAARAVAPLAGKRILLVEDDLPTLRILARLLEQRGHAVTAAGSVSAALAVAEREDFDLIISDIALPDGTGLDLPRRLGNHRPVPAIALSGYGMDDDVRKSQEAGFAAHLTKPVDFPKLEATIRHVTSGRGRSS
jgi:signal transduction histidine kinase/ActR/RegA family two-component response regulator